MTFCEFCDESLGLCLWQAKWKYHLTTGEAQYNNDTCSLKGNSVECRPKFCSPSSAIF